MSRDGCVALPRGVIGLSAVCDCGINPRIGLIHKLSIDSKSLMTL